MYVIYGCSSKSIPWFLAPNNGAKYGFCLMEQALKPIGACLVTSITSSPLLGQVKYLAIIVMACKVLSWVRLD